MLGACDCEGYIFKAPPRLFLYSAAPVPKANHVVRGRALFFRHLKWAYPIKDVA